MGARASRTVDVFPSMTVVAMADVIVVSKLSVTFAFAGGVTNWLGGEVGSAEDGSDDGADVGCSEGGSVVGWDVGSEVGGSDVGSDVGGWEVGSDVGWDVGGSEVGSDVGG